MKKNLYTLAVILLISIPFISQSQTAGTLDLTFNSTGLFTADNGFNDLFTDVKVQPDQKIVAAGISYDASWSASIRVIRLMPDGSYDPTFGTGGVFSYSLNYEANAYAIQFQEGGKILVGGMTTGSTGYDILLLRLNEDGTLDNSFGTNGVTVQDMGPGDDIVYDMALQEDGRIVVAGIKSDLMMINAPMVARFTAEGQLDASFGTGGMLTIPVTESENEFASVLVQPDGKIIASGHIANSITSFTVLVARCNADGTPDYTFGNEGIINYPVNNADDEAQGMQLTAAGDILISGFTVDSDYNFLLLLMKFDATGNIVSSFGSNGTVILGTDPMNVGYDLEIQPDKKILVAGTSGQGMIGPRSFALWRFGEDGTIDNTFGTDGFVTTAFFGNADEANALCLQADGKIILAGKAHTGTNLDFAMARYLNDINTGLNETSGQTLTVSPNPVPGGRLLTARIDLSSPSAMSAALYDLVGNLFASYDLGALPAGKAEFRIPTPQGIAPGAYLLRITGEHGIMLTRKIIVIN